MSGLQRSSPRLKARASPYHSGVTLFAMPDASGSATPPRPTKRVKIESALDEPSISGEGSQSPSKSPSKRPLKSPQKSKTLYKKALATPHPTPLHWREVYDCIKEMRSQTVAPVDTMGCHMAQRYEKDPKVGGTLFFGSCYSK